MESVVISIFMINFRVYKYKKWKRFSTNVTFLEQTFLNRKYTKIRFHNDYI